MEFSREKRLIHDDRLSQELAESSLSHIPANRIRKVLSYFPPSQDYQRNIDRISTGILDSLTESAEATTQLISALSDIVEKVKSTRELNETYLGHMTPQPTVMGIWGNVLASLVNANTIAREASLGESQLEPEAIKFLIDLVGYDIGKASGVFTTGGTEANHTALTAARILLTNDAKNNAQMTEAVVLASPYAHYSLSKSIKQLGGLNEDIKIVKIKPDNFRMSVSDLTEKLERLKEKNTPIMAIFAIAGETETGLVDDFQQISALAKKYNVRLIVDGAYGAPYRISRVGDKFDGMEEAFAITVDPHKTLYTPYSAGAVLFRNAEDHAWIGMLSFASYAHFSERYPAILDDIKQKKGNLGQKRLGGSMGAGPILSTLANIRTIGIEGYQTIFDLTIDRIMHLYDRLKESDILFPLYKPDINLLCFGLRDTVAAILGISNNDGLGQFINRHREILDKGMVGKGEYFFSTTNLPLDNATSQWVFRACLMNPRTTNRIIDSAIEQLEQNIIYDIQK